MNADPEGAADRLPSAVRRYQTVRDELGRFSERLNETACDTARWETLMSNLRAGLSSRSGANLLGPSERVHLYCLAAVGMQHGRSESVLYLVREFLAQAPDDFLLWYLESTLSNRLGVESSCREQLLEELSAFTLSAEEPPFEVRPASDPRAPVLSVVLSTWNRLQSVSRTLYCLRRHTRVPYEVVVYDNHSTDGTVDHLTRLQEKWPQLCVIYSAGHRYNVPSYNLAFGMARGEIIGCLADDVEVTPGWENQLVQTLRSRPCVGAVTPLVLRPDGTIFFYTGVLRYLSGKNPWISSACHPDEVEGKTPEDIALPPEPRDVECGMYLFLRRDVFQRIKMFDARYIHHWADFDASLQIRQLGLQLAVCPRSRVIDHVMPHLAPARSALEQMEEFTDLFYAPENVRAHLRLPASIFWRFFRDRLVFENRWQAAPA